MNKEEIVRKIINKVKNDEKLDNKEKDYLLCIANDWFLFKQRIDKAIEKFDNQNLNKYYYGMSYEFEINDFKKDLLNILKGE